MFEATAMDPTTKDRTYNERRSRTTYAVMSNVPEITWRSDENLLWYIL